MEKIRKLHIGCGLNFQPDWINLDGSWNARLAKFPKIKKLARVIKLVPQKQLDIDWSPDILIHDVRGKLPFEDSSISVVYASHLLEHLYLEEAKKLLRECYRVLGQGGVLRMMVPDLGEIVLEYTNNSTKEKGMLRADVLVQNLHFSDPNPPSGGFIYKLYSHYKDFHTHKWMYDEESLINYFNEAGFKDVKRMSVRESAIEDIKTIEIRDGLCVEGIK